MPGRELFGEQIWDTFSRAHTADAYLLRPDPEGPIAGKTAFDSSARRDPQAFHRIWSFLQDYHTFELGVAPESIPVPEYLVRYGRDGRSVDLVLDVNSGLLAIYVTGAPQSAKWISVKPAVQELTLQFDQLFDRRRVRDLRPNL